MKQRKLKAGALQFTIFITVLIALLLASFVILVNTHKRFNVQSDFLVQSIKYSKSGIDHALKNNLPINQTTILDREGNEVLVTKDFWGIFEKITATNTIKNKTHSKIALIGSALEEEETALYLKDNNKPLVVVGNTRIQGTAYLPKQGVRPGNISGTSYYGIQLIYGRTHLSKTFPEITKEVIDILEMYTKKSANYTIEEFVTIPRTNALQQSFYEPRSVVYETSDIDLSNTSLTGHIVLQSETKIIIDVTSKLTDVVLIAPEIIIKNNVKGRFQAIASKRITVGNNCNLEYPSALVLSYKKPLQTNDQQQEDQHIMIDKNTTINGMILCLGEAEKNNYKSQVFVEEGATIRGEVYCNQNIDLRGSVYGKVYANNFIAAQSGSIYQNHLFNATINIDNLPEQYVGVSFKNTNKEVLKWLY